MILEDLKVESASVNVSNANQADAEYKISANLFTREGKLNRVDGGMVMRNSDGVQVANFYVNMEYEKSLSVTYMNELHDNVAAQCVVNQLINDYINLSTEKALSEANE